jgi:hypothetical protein
MSCQPATNIALLTLVALSMLSAEPAFGEWNTVVQQVKVQVADCRTPAQAAPEIREEYAKRWRREGEKGGLPSPDHLDQLESMIRNETVKILRGRVISVRDAAGSWQREGEPQDRLFVWNTDRACREVKKGDVLEMFEGSERCDDFPSSTAACVLGSSFVEAPAPREKTPGDARPAKQDERPR